MINESISIGNIQAVIMAGGKGTRLGELSKELPKPLVPINGKPILEYEIENLREHGIYDILITVSYMADKIIEYFGDGSSISPVTGKSYGVNISYYIEEQPLGNAGALFSVKDNLADDFFLLNADSFFDVDLERMMSYHKSRGGLATILVHPNDHPYDSGLIVSEDSGLVVQWLNKEDKRPEYYHNQVNAGIHVLSKRVLEESNIRPIGKVDLDRDILKPLAGLNKLCAYKSPEYVKDIGTPERYDEVCRDVKHGVPMLKNLNSVQRAFFLDRDGTINKAVNFLKNINDFELEDGVAEAVRFINKSGYLAIVVTNQPVVARGEVTISELDKIHMKLETLLGNEGAYIDALYYCPHHPDKGFEGEISELKIECECRKPKPGMLIRAAKDYNIDLSTSWMIGDMDSDIQAGYAAGCKTVRIDKSDRIGENYVEKKVTADMTVGSLLEGVKSILFKGIEAR